MGRHIRALIILSDNSPLHLIFLKTITPRTPRAKRSPRPPPGLPQILGASEAGNVASPLFDDPVAKLTGKYWLFKSLADAHLRLNEHVGEHCFGDAFVVKVAGDGGDEKGDAAYLDVSREVVGSESVGKMVKMLGESTEK